MLRTLQVASCGLLLLTAACAAPAAPEKMAVHPAEFSIKANPQYKGKMAIRNITGGEETSPMWKSRVGDNEMRTALQNSLEGMGYAAADESKAKYFIDANLQEIDQPTLGFTLDITSKIEYTVEGPKGEKSFPITAVGTATPGDAFLGVERLKMANERSIQENIKSFLTHLSMDGKLSPAR